MLSSQTRWADRDRRRRKAKSRTRLLSLSDIEDNDLGSVFGGNVKKELSKGLTAAKRERRRRRSSSTREGDKGVFSSTAASNKGTSKKKNVNRVLGPVEDIPLLSRDPSLYP